MARSYKVTSGWNEAWNGRVTVTKDSCAHDSDGCYLEVAEPGWYFGEITHRDGSLVLGWELTNADTFFNQGGFGGHEEPDVLLIDPLYAPQGAKLFDLIRRVYAHRNEAPRPAGVGAT